MVDRRRGAVTRRRQRTDELVSWRPVPVGHRRAPHLGRRHRAEKRLILVGHENSSSLLTGAIQDPRSGRRSVVDQSECETASSALFDRKRNPELEERVDEQLLVFAQVDRTESNIDDDCLHRVAVRFR